ncbi:hypothetical protein QCA50_009611 [Cerrena zonata]|uniref:Epoxide hydrolase N-terminal domain-containing protein n=1 Tax=Cerrena zonata TaxID=2478898 RepID=A0AAW0G6P6_9APHY
MTETPFTLAVSDEDLNLLKQKLDLVRFPDELENANWDYGVPLEDIKRLVGRWKDSFDWRASEATINSIPQFTRDIDIEGFGTLNIHYVHQKSQLENAIPLLFVHGWPGHFMEISKLLPLLTAPETDGPSFHVVAFSIPGFGFSEAPTKPGFSMNQYAELGHKLMLSLGYKEYVGQGGDLGYHILHRQVQFYGGTHIKAWHTNFPCAEQPTFSSSPLIYLQNLVRPYSVRDKQGFERTKWFLEKGKGYFAEHTTKPQTIGYSLGDSPVGLLAWIYEKLVNWSDNYSWTDDEVLAWVSIYWFSRAGPAASIRIYYEYVQGGEAFKSKWSPTPLGASFFPQEIHCSPVRWAGTLGNVKFTSVHESGGHFAAHEKPEALVDDLRKMFGIGGPAFGLVPGKTGYATA